MSRRIQVSARRKCYRLRDPPVLCLVVVVVVVVVFFSPNRSFYSTTPVVDPVPILILHIREIQIMWSQTVGQRKTKMQSRINQSRQIKCQHTGYEITTNTLTKKITTTKNKTSKTNGILR